MGALRNGLLNVTSRREVLRPILVNGRTNIGSRYVPILLTTPTYIASLADQYRLIPPQVVGVRRRVSSRPQSRRTRPAYRLRQFVIYVPLIANKWVSSYLFLRAMHTPNEYKRVPHYCI